MKATIKTIAGLLCVASALAAAPDVEIVSQGAILRVGATRRVVRVKLVHAAEEVVPVP